VEGIQLLAPIKNGLKFFQREILMRITIITEEEITHKGLAGFKGDYTMTGLGRSLYVFLDEGIDALRVISVVADLDGMVMIAQINARTLEKNSSFSNSK
jgi:hypothetical protein